MQWRPCRRLPAAARALHALGIVGARPRPGETGLAGTARPCLHCAARLQAYSAIEHRSVCWNSVATPSSCCARYRLSSTAHSLGARTLVDLPLARTVARLSRANLPADKRAMADAAEPNCRPACSSPQDRVLSPRCATGWRSDQVLTSPRQARGLRGWSATTSPTTGPGDRGNLAGPCGGSACWRPGWPRRRRASRSCSA